MNPLADPDHAPRRATTARPRLGAGWLLLALGAALTGAGCGGAPEGPPRPQPRLVLLYATCTLNKGFLGTYGDATGITPHLDAFASRSQVFERHESESGQSGISFASIFSGTQADRHGVYYHPVQLKDELYLVTEAFRDAGYEPWFWSGHKMASYDLGYGQGVDPERVFVGKTRAQKLSFLQPQDPQFQALLQRLADDPEYRAFALVDFTVTHGAYHRQRDPRAYPSFLADHPELAGGLTPADLEWAWGVYAENRWDLQWDYPATLERLGFDDATADRLDRALELTYRADVAGLDAMFGRTLELVRAHGLADDALIAVTADHGETLQREGTLFKWTHGLQLAPEVLSVPWILSAPTHASIGFAPGRYPGVTRSMDVFPTLAGLCGVELAGRGVEGADLSDALLGEAAPPELVAYSHTTAIGPDTLEDFLGWGLASRYFDSSDIDRIWVRMRAGDRVFKWRHLGDERWGMEVFDLASDPHELRDLADPADPEHARMESELRAYKSRLEAAFAGAALEAPEDALDRLEELGYTESGAEESGDQGAAPDAPPDAMGETTGQPAQGGH